VQLYNTELEKMREANTKSLEADKERAAQEREQLAKSWKRSTVYNVLAAEMTTKWNGTTLKDIQDKLKDKAIRDRFMNAAKINPSDISDAELEQLLLDLIETSGGVPHCR